MQKSNAEYHLEKIGVYIPSIVYFLKHQAKAADAYEEAIEDEDSYVVDGIEATITYCVNEMLKAKIDHTRLRQFINIYQKAKPGQMIKLDKSYYVVKKATPSNKDYKKPVLPTESTFKKAVNT